MNKIEGNYLSPLNIRDTQEALNLINETIRKEIEEKFEVLFIREPIVSSERISTNLSALKGKRQINFDGSNDNSVYYIYNAYKYWLLKSLEVMEIKNNNAIATFTTSIDRDVEIKNTQTMERRSIHIEYRFDNKKIIFEKATEINKTLISIIKNVEKVVCERFPALKTNMPKNITEKKMSRINKKISIGQALSDIGANEKIFNLVDKKTESNKSIHNNFAISLKGYSREINEAFDIYKIKDRKTIDDLKPETAESETVMEEYIFGKDILTNHNLRTINIEINLDTLSMLLLNKTHLLEIQSGKNIDEIEKILSGADIKHL